MARRIDDGTTQADYTLDVMLTRFRQLQITSGAGVTVRTHHYADDGDTPVVDCRGFVIHPYPSRPRWSGGNLSRRLDTVHWKLRNLHGDFIATIEGTAPGVSAVHETNEFGMTRTGNGPAGRYGWLGSALRDAANPAGLILMGVRLYNPATGRFLSADRHYAGSANAYDYASQDPINESDTAGTSYADATSPAGHGPGTAPPTSDGQCPVHVPVVREFAELARPTADGLHRRRNVLRFRPDGDAVSHPRC
jgi:RHS repeat-associated protein